MRKGEWLLVLVVVVFPSCAAPGSSSQSAAFGPKHLYARRVPPAPQPRLPRMEKPRHTLPDLTGRLPQTTWYPHHRPISDRWTTIVIHHSATSRGSAASFDRNHRARGWDALGYHFVIGNGTDTPDGKVEVGIRWEQQKHGAHCKTPGNYFNDHGIGICLVGDFTKTRPTRKQLESLDRLVAFLSQACGIPPQRVTTHGHINHKTRCPGQNFALGPVRRHVAQALSHPGARRPALASHSRFRRPGA